MSEHEQIPPIELVRRIHAIDSQLGHGRRLSLIEVDRLVRENPYMDPGGEAYDALPKEKGFSFLRFLFGEKLKAMFKLGYSAGRIEGVKSALEMSDQDVSDAISIASEMRVHSHLIKSLDKKDTPSHP